MNVEEIKIGLIGLGHISNYQINAINNTKGLKLTRLYDIDKSKAQLLSGQCKFSSSLEDFLGSNDIDLVLISTPPTSHYQLAVKALEKGKNVFVEKPICTELDQIQSLIKLSNSKKKSLSVALHSSFGKDVLWWKDHASEYSYLGKITGFECSFFDPYIQNGSLLTSAFNLGGSWLDSGINALSVIALFISPDNLKLEQCIKTIITPISNLDIQANSILTFNNGETNCFGTINTNWTLGVSFKTTRLFYGNSNTVVTLHHSKQEVIIQDYSNKILEIIPLNNNMKRLDNHYFGVFEDLENMIRNGQNNLKYNLSLHKLLLSNDTCYSRFLESYE